MSPNTYLDPRDLSDPHPSYDAQRYDDESATRQVWRARDQESQDQPVDQTMLSADCKEAGRHQEENGYYDTQVDGRAYRDQNQGYEGDLAEGQGGYDGGYYGAGHGDDGTAEEEEDGRYEYDEERNPHQTINDHQMVNDNLATPSHSEHIVVDEVAGRRILMKRAGNKRGPSEEDEDRASDADVPSVAFDPTAEIESFNPKKELVEEWDKIQEEVAPFLQEYCKNKLKDTYDEILNVAHLFYQLNEDAKADLELGVSKIVEEEIKQAACREVIVAFSKQMSAVAAALSQFGAPAPVDSGNQAASE